MENLNRYLAASLDFTESRDYFFGGAPRFMAAGPCALESPEQAMASARFLDSLKISFMRAFPVKMRTSPYHFQGMNDAAIPLLRDLRATFPAMRFIAELFSERQFALFGDLVDVVQVGARSMYSPELLSFLGALDKPTILKRGLSATVYEWLSMAEYYLLAGGRRIILCERGTRSFEPTTRNSFDITSYSSIRDISKIPVIADPSHAAGAANRVLPLARAAIAAGYDGLIVETHPDPASALSDKGQQLTFEDFGRLVGEIGEM